MATRKRELRLSKIYLKEFIDVLVNIYNEGADFIDLIGIPDVEQDTIRIEVKNEYLADEAEEGDNMEKLTDDDINGLIDG